MKQQLSPAWETRRDNLGFYARVPYYPPFNTQARALRGEFDKAKKEWHFSSTVDGQVTAICRQTWGDFGQELVDVLIECDTFTPPAGTSDGWDQKTVYCGAYPLATRWNEKLAIDPRIKKISGGWSSTAVKPFIVGRPNPGTVLVVREVPIGHACDVLMAQPGVCIMTDNGKEQFYKLLPSPGTDDEAREWARRIVSQIEGLRKYKGPDFMAEVLREAKEGMDLVGKRPKPKAPPTPAGDPFARVLGS